MTPKSSLAWLWRSAIGAAIGAFFLWFVFRDTDWRAVREALARVEWRWVAFSQLLLWSSHFVRIQRWSYAVRAVRPTSFRTLLAAAQLGTLFNLVLPLRLGDAVRMLVLARLGRFRLTQAAAMVALDRLAEMLGLLTTFAVMLFGFPMNRDLTLPVGAVGNAAPIVLSSGLVRSAIFVSAGLFVAIMVLLGFVHASRRRWGTMQSTRRPVRAVLRLLAGFTDGLNGLGSGAVLFGTYLFTVLAWGLNAATLAALLHAFGIDHAWYAPLVLLVLLAVFVAAPIAPGLVGQFHLPLIAGLLLATEGSTLSQAKALTLVAYVGTVIPVAALGAYGFVATGLGWRNLFGASQRREASGDLDDEAPARDTRPRRGR